MKLMNERKELWTGMKLMNGRKEYMNWNEICEWNE